MEKWINKKYGDTKNFDRKDMKEVFISGAEHFFEQLEKKIARRNLFEIQKVFSEFEVRQWAKESA